MECGCHGRSRHLAGVEGRCQRAISVLYGWGALRLLTVFEGKNTWRFWTAQAMTALPLALVSMVAMTVA
jgi:hypothetical protein